MSNYIQVSNVKLEELKSKVDALPTTIATNDQSFHVHNSKTTAEHLDDISTKHTTNHTKQDEMIALLEGQTPAGNRPKAIPVQIMVGNAGSQHSALRGVGGDLSVYIDDMNADVAVNSGLSTATNQATANASLATIAGDTTSLDGKIVACNTGAVVVSSGSITETNSAAILADTASLDTKITKGSDASLSTAQQVLSYGSNGGSLHPLKVGANGELTTEVDHTWTTSTLVSLQAVADGGTVQGDFDLGNGISHELTPLKFFITNSASVNVSVQLQMSPDNSNWFDDASGNLVEVNGQAFTFSGEDAGAGDGHRYIRCIVSNNAGDSTATNISVVMGYYA